jgi:vancomycin resistance protein YoaR
VPDLFLSTAARRPRRGRRALIVLGTILAVLALGAVALGGIALMERGRIPAGTTVAGVDVGRKTREEARRTIRRALRPTIARPIRLLGTGGEATTSGSELGARPLVDAALDEALDTSPFDRVLRRLGVGNARKLGLAYRFGPVRAAEVANRLDRLFGEPARNARVVIGERETTIEPPAPGTRIDRGALRSGLRTLPPELGLPLRKVPPAVGVSAARRAKRTVDRLLDGPRSVRFRATEAPLSVSLLRSLIVTAPLGREIVVGLDPHGLRAALLPRLGRFETPPHDARFTIDGPRVRIVPSVPGRKLAAARIGASLVSNLRAVVHRARFTRSEPALTTAAARKLRITELVSEFTTNYPCCPTRVTNIKRAAALLDGTVIRPGKEFSLNGALGKRTEAKGFVSAPQIFDGRLEDSVGGGISQVSTTLFNAAFFAGLKLVAHQAHQFYISRYPMGREATISWGGPEMIFRNDWPAAILMKLDASDSGITVRFYSTKLGRRVETTTGEPYAFTAARTITISNPSLPPGSKTVVQEAGPSGFTVQYTRKVFRGAKRIRNETYTVKYDAENGIIENGPPKKAQPAAKPKPAAPAQ